MHNIMKKKLLTKVSPKEFRSITHLAFAEIIEDNKYSIRYADVFEVPEAKMIKLSREGEPFFTKNDDEYEITLDYVSLETLAKLSGKEFDSVTGSFINNGVHVNKYFAIGYKTRDFNGDYVYVWNLKCEFIIPSCGRNDSDNDEEFNIHLKFKKNKTNYRFFKSNENCKQFIHSDRNFTVDEKLFFSSVQTIDTIDELRSKSTNNIAISENVEVTLSSGSVVTIRELLKIYDGNENVEFEDICNDEEYVKGFKEYLEAIK